MKASGWSVAAVAILLGGLGFLVWKRHTAASAIATLKKGPLIYKEGVPNSPVKTAFVPLSAADDGATKEVTIAATGLGVSHYAGQKTLSLNSFAAAQTLQPAARADIVLAGGSPIGGGSASIKPVTTFNKPWNTGLTQSLQIGGGLVR